MMTAVAFSEIFIRHWADVRESLSDKHEDIIVDSMRLTLANIVAAARYLKTQFSYSH